MFILRRGNLTLGLRTGYILPKQPLSPLICAQFETFSKQQRSQEPGFNLEKKTEVLPKYCQKTAHFRLPRDTEWTSAGAGGGQRDRGRYEELAVL